MAKLCKAMQAETLTCLLLLISFMLHFMYWMMPCYLQQFWILELLNTWEALEAVTDTTVTVEDISSFQERVAKPFVRDLKSNISSRFASQDVVSCFSIFDPKKVPNLDSSDLSSYGEDAVEILIDHYGADRPAETALGVEVCTPALISCELHIQKWKTFRHFLAKKTDMKTVKRIAN